MRSNAIACLARAAGARLGAAEAPQPAATTQTQTQTQTARTGINP